LIGGDEDLVSEMKYHVETKYGFKVEYSLSGFIEKWSEQQLSIYRRPVDVLLVGMGMPLEVFFVHERLEHFDSKLIITCGGLFKFMTGLETRAPSLVRKLNLEWFWRMARNPRVLTRRYFVGAINLIRVLL